MNYEIVKSSLPNETGEFINVIGEDGSITAFPAENSNPAFISFLRELEKTNDPYFLAWVEAGNDPDEFWSQDTLGGAI